MSSLSSQDLSGAGPCPFYILSSVCCPRPSSRMPTDAMWEDDESMRFPLDFISTFSQRLVPYLLLVAVLIIS